MANRIPLIVNSNAKQIQELPNGDSLNGIANITATGTITAEQITSTDDINAAGTITAEQNTSTDDINAADDITAGGEFIGAGTIPVGGIIMWSGAISAIPTNYNLCNGNNGTPDLRNKFIVGATSDGSDTTYPGLQPGATGGDADATLVSHSHTTNTIIEHQDVGNSTKQLTGNLGIDAFINGTGIFENTGANSNFIDNTGAANHTNTVTMDARHRHGTDTQGVSATNKNLPPYYALAYIMRTT